METTFFKPQGLRIHSIKLLQAVEIVHPQSNQVTTTLILGSIKYIHMRNDVLDPERGVVDPNKLKPVGRMGGTLYNKVSEGFIIPRQFWKEKGEEIQKVIANKAEGAEGKVGGDGER